MRRRNRTVEIFSLSAIDLFASALGAFVIVTAILIPYYPNLKNGGSALESLQKALSQNESDRAQAIAEAQALQQQIEKKKVEAETADSGLARKQTLERTAQQLAATNQALERELAALQRELSSIPEPKARPVPSAPNLVTDFSILGITTEAKRIVLAVDLSGSMIDFARTLTDTLLAIIEPFHSDMQFAIIGFQGAGVTQYWPVQGRMAVADARSKADARRFIAGIPTVLNGSTPTNTALLRALQYRPDAIILISDGEPTDDDAGDIVSRITTLNKKKVEINTVAIGKYLEHPQLVRFLNDLAKGNRGQFVGVISE